MDKEWDCVIVGGGAAGLSAALVLGRAAVMQTLLNGDVGLPVPPWPNVNSTKENNYAHA